MLQTGQQLKKNEERTNVLALCSIFTHLYFTWTFTQTYDCSSYFSSCLRGLERLLPRLPSLVKCLLPPLVTCLRLEEPLRGTEDTHWRSCRKTSRGQWRNGLEDGNEKERVWKTKKSRGAVSVRQLVGPGSGPGSGVFGCASTVQVSPLSDLPNRIAGIDLAELAPPAGHLKLLLRVGNGGKWTWKLVGAGWRVRLAPVGQFLSAVSVDLRMIQ